LNLRNYAGGKQDTYNCGVVEILEVRIVFATLFWVKNVSAGLIAAAIVGTPMSALKRSWQ
jgi:hypothetical protein